MVRLAVPTFVTVKVWFAEVPPTTTDPKFFEAGAIEMSCCVISTSAVYSVEPPSSSKIVPLTVNVPAVDGAVQSTLLVPDGALYAAAPHLKA